MFRPRQSPWPAATQPTRKNLMTHAVALRPHDHDTCELAQWPLLRTKLLRPLLPQHHVERLTLGSRFADHAGHCCIYGSAGYGKTTLAAAWCSGWVGSVGWLSLDREDDDPHRFALYLAASFVAACPSAATRFAADLQLGDVVSAILNEALLLQSPILLVLDDYHLISRLAIHDSLSLLLTRSSPNLRLLILSRSRPPLKLASLELQNRILTLGSADLALDHSSCVTYLSQACPDIDSSSITDLLQAVEGWPAGLRSLALLLGRRPSAHPVSLEQLISSGTITAYLWEQVLSQLSPELQQFLLHSAVLGTFNAESCAAVCGQAASPALIEEAVRRQLFITAFNSGGVWYRYHTLFQHYLAARLQDTDPATCHTLHRSAAQYWLRRGELTRSLEHALAIEAPELVSAALCHPRQALLAQGNAALLERAIVSLNDELICTRAPLLMLACRYWLSRSHEKVLALLDKASAQLQAECQDGDQAHMQALVDLYRAQVCFGREQLTQGVELAGRSLQHLPADDYRSRSEIAVLLAEAHTRQGEAEAARREWQNGEQLARQAGTHTLVVWSMHQRALLDIGEGLFACALGWQQRAIAYGEQHRISSGNSLWCVYRARAELAWELFNLDEAALFCAKAEAVTRHWLHDDSLPVLIIRARCLLLQGQSGDAGKLLQQASALRQTQSCHSYVGSALDQALAEFHLRCSPASALFQLAQTLTRPTHYCNEIAQRQGRAMALCLLGSGDAAGAAQLLLTMNQAACQVNLLTDQWRNDLWLLVCLQQMESSDQRLWHACLQFAAARGLLGGLLLVAPHLGSLLLEESGLGDEALRHLRRVRDLLSHSRARPQRNCTVPLAMSALAITARDWSIFELLLEGASNEEIAVRLHLALGTVKNAITRIYRKLDVNDREAACRIGQRVLNQQQPVSMAG